MRDSKPSQNRGHLRRLHGLNFHIDRVLKSDPYGLSDIHAF